MLVRPAASEDPCERLRLWLAGGAPPVPSGPADEEALVAAAQSQGVAPRLAAAVGAGPGWSAPTVERLRQLERASLVRSVRQLDLAARVLSLLWERGWRVLPLKGAALAEAYYPGSHLRAMSDVDLLVLEDWPGAERALADAGFPAVSRADHAAALRDPDSGELLELHHALSSCPGFFPCDAAGWWQRSRRVPGQVGRLPAAEDLLVQLSVHAAFQHGLVLSLGQYLDFAQLLRPGVVAVEPLLLSARASRAEAALAAALAAAQLVLGLEPPPRLREQLDAWLPPGIRRFLGRRQPLGLITPRPAALGQVRWALARGRRVELLRRTLLSVEPGEPGTLPAALLQVATRAVGLLRRHILPQR